MKYLSILIAILIASKAEDKRDWLLYMDNNLHIKIGVDMHKCDKHSCTKFKSFIIPPNSGQKLHLKNQTGCILYPHRILDMYNEEVYYLDKQLCNAFYSADYPNYKTIEISSGKSGQLKCDVSYG